MMSKILHSAAALLGAVIISTTIGGHSARAQSCPYFTSKQIDRWFLETTQFADRADQKLLCVDDPGFITFDFLDRSAPRSFYLDVTYATSWTQAEYTLEASPTTTSMEEAEGAMTGAEARACRRQIVTSRVWSVLGCPTN